MRCLCAGRRGVLYRFVLIMFFFSIGVARGRVRSVELELAVSICGRTPMLPRVPRVWHVRIMSFPCAGVGVSPINVRLQLCENGSLTDPFRTARPHLRRGVEWRGAGSDLPLLIVVPPVRPACVVPRTNRSGAETAEGSDAVQLLLPLIPNGAGVHRSPPRVLNVVKQWRRGEFFEFVFRKKKTGVSSGNFVLSIMFIKKSKLHRKNRRRIF